MVKIGTCSHTNGGVGSKRSNDSIVVGAARRKNDRGPSYDHERREEEDEEEKIGSCGKWKGLLILEIFFKALGLIIFCKWSR